MAPRPPLTLRQKTCRSLKIGVIASVVFIVGWRQYRVWRIPEVVPFDRQAFLARYDRDENEFHIFREASGLYHAAFTPEFQEAEQDFLGRWEDAKPVTRDFMEAMRPALGHWLSGSDAEMSFEVHPEDCDVTTLIPICQEMRFFVWLVRIENSRLISEGDFEGAIANYLNAVRILNLHADDGVIYWLVCTHCYDVLRSQLETILHGKELRADALAGLQDELTKSLDRLARLSAPLQYAYFFSAQHVEERLESQTVPNFLMNEPELARRTINQVYHNLLAESDASPEERPDVVRTEFSTSLRDLNTFLRRHGYWHFQGRKESLTIEYFQPATKDDVVQEAFGSLSYASEIVEESLPAVKQLVGRRDSLCRQIHLDLIEIALHGYHREHGQFPNTLEDLVPEWIDEVPVDVDGRAYQWEKNTAGCRLLLEDGTELFEVVPPE